MSDSVALRTVALWTVTLQAPSVHGFPRQEYQGGLHFHLWGIFLDQGSNPHLQHWHLDSLPMSYLGSLRTCTGYLIDDTESPWSSFTWLANLPSSPRTYLHICYGQLSFSLYQVNYANIIYKNSKQISQYASGNQHIPSNPGSAPTISSLPPWTLASIEGKCSL